MAQPAVTTTMLVSELQDLLRLTAFESTVATARRAQAATGEVAAELKANAAKSVERAALLSDAIRGLGGVPDVVGAALSRAGAFVQTQVNQVQTLQGALLGDLALEHQLRDRTRYARTLAQTLGEEQVVPVLDRLDSAHSETVSWLQSRLTEAGRTGTSAIRATPVQGALGAVRAVARVPFTVVAGVVNRGTSLLHRGAKTAVDEVVEVVEVAQQLPGTVRDVVDAATDTASEPDLVLDLTGVDPQHEPFAAFHRLTGDSIIRHVAELEDIEELRATLAYETAHKQRKGVLQALQARVQELGVNA